jgi:hypothetical protein
MDPPSREAMAGKLQIYADGTWNGDLMGYDAGLWREHLFCRAFSAKRFF